MRYFLFTLLMFVANAVNGQSESRSIAQQNIAFELLHVTLIEKKLSGESSHLHADFSSPLTIQSSDPWLKNYQKTNPFKPTKFDYIIAHKKQKYKNAWDEVVIITLSQR